MRRGKLFGDEKGRECRCSTCGCHFIIGEEQAFFPPTCNKRDCVNHWLKMLCKRQKDKIPKNFKPAACTKADVVKLRDKLVAFVKQGNFNTNDAADLIDIVMLVANKVGVKVDIWKMVPKEERPILQKASSRAA